jgi:hypothetical protein
MSRRPPRRDVFRSTGALRWIVALVTMIFVAGLTFSYVNDGPRSWPFVGFLALTLLGVLGIVETWVSRVELHDDHIRVVMLFKRRQYARGDVTSVTWAKGSPVSIQLNGTRWVDLPNMGHASTKVAGAVRAWLNEGETRHQHVRT